MHGPGLGPWHSSGCAASRSDTPFATDCRTGDKPEHILQISTRPCLDQPVRIGRTVALSRCPESTNLPTYLLTEIVSTKAQPLPCTWQRRWNPGVLNGQLVMEHGSTGPGRRDQEVSA